MRRLMIFVVIIAIAVCLTACSNRQYYDTTFYFSKAIISLPDGTVIKGKVDSWRDFEDGDQIQIKMDGKTYLLHSSNAVLIAE